MKKAASFIFLLVLFLCFSAGGTLGAQQFDSEDYFTITSLDGGVSAVITGYTGTGTVVRIPPNIQGMPVTAIGDGAFQNRRLTSVTIPQGVRTIGNQAFFGNRLSSVDIPAGVSRIGNQAFMNNILASAAIPNSVILIGDQAFSNNRLVNVNVPNNMVTVGDRAFMNNLIDHVTILNSMATIGNQAFRGNGVNSVTIGANVQIDSTAFGQNFHIFYNNNRQRAGVYTWTGRDWSFREN